MLERKNVGNGAIHPQPNSKKSSGCGTLAHGDRTLLFKLDTFIYFKILNS
jgi:hypothetical protein